MNFTRHLFAYQYPEVMDNDQISSIENSPCNKFQYAITDIDGILRGKIVSKEKLLKGLTEKMGFCNVVFGWDCNDEVYNNGEVTGWHTGYRDSFATIDLATQRNIPWHNNLPFFLADFRDSQQLSEVCPRTLLHNIANECAGMGYRPMFAKEFEWFNFKETGQTLKDKNFVSPTPFTTGMFGYSVLRISQNQLFYNDIFDQLLQIRVPLEGLHTETGDGVCEAAIDYTDVLEAADRAVLFKSSVKEIAARHGLMACFMAKWNASFPGCSGHIHQSLWNEDKSINHFYDPSHTDNMSEVLQQYIAGQLFCLPHILPFYAPTVNSYKRYVEGAWSSTSVSWGIENRTTALRVINHSAGATRLETRVPGADANPYLSMAASLASGLFGIKNKLSLTVPQTIGSAYGAPNAALPKTLKEAITAMKQSNIAETLFGKVFTDHFIKTREWEWNKFAQSVTDWELKRYFEII